VSQVEPSPSAPSAPARLVPGDPAPDFELPAHDGSRVRLSALRGTKVVVYFYPAAMTPGCTTQACDFRDNLASLQGAGYRVLGVSPDDVPRLARFAERDGLTFPLLSDGDRSVMTRWGAFGEKKLYGKVVTGVIRSTVVVDEDGTVVLARYNVKATGHVRMLRTALGLDA
jgi:peroxiredoxin Q/BCP